LIFQLGIAFLSTTITTAVYRCKANSHYHHLSISLCIRSEVTSRSTNQL